MRDKHARARTDSFVGVFDQWMLGRGLVRDRTGKKDSE